MAWPGGARHGQAGQGLARFWQGMEQRAVHFGPLVALFGQSKQTVVTLAAVPAAVTSGKKFRKYLTRWPGDLVAWIDREDRERKRRWIILLVVFAYTRAKLLSLLCSHAIGRKNNK